MEAFLTDGASFEQTDRHGRMAARYSYEYQKLVNGEAVRMFEILQRTQADVAKADRYTRMCLH